MVVDQNSVILLIFCGPLVQFLNVKDQSIYPCFKFVFDALFLYLSSLKFNLSRYNSNFVFIIMRFIKINAVVNSQ